MKTITKADAIQANYVKSTLQPVVDAVRKVTAQSLGYQTKHVELCLQTVVMLEAHIKQANGVFDAIQSNYDDLSKTNLIGRVVTRYMSIDSDIELHTVKIKYLRDGHEHKVESLKHDGFTAKQIDQIEPYPQAEIDEHNAAIAKLEADREKFRAFIESSPAYEVHHLEGTTFDVSQEAVEALQ